MPRSSLRLPLLASIVACVFALALTAHAQTDNRMLLNPWPEKVWGETVDHILYEVNESDIQGDPNSAQVFWWNSIGRFRLNTTSEAPIHIGYRYVTMDFDTKSDKIP